VANYEWMVPPVKPVLVGDDVHVWCAATNLAEQQVYLLAQTLSIDELIGHAKKHMSRRLGKVCLGNATG
jgi:hypothetical protein